MLAFGGAGAIHAAEVARQLRIPEVIVPAHPGTPSAFGMLAADIEYDGVSSYLTRASEIDAADLDRRFHDLDERGRRRLREDGIAGISIDERRSADMRYAGQSYELEIPFTHAPAAIAIAEAVSAFHHRHNEIHGHADPTRPVEIVNIRAVHSQRLDIPAFTGSRETFTDTRETRRAYFSGLGWHDTPILRRSAIAVGQRVHGRAIVEQHDTTIVVYPGQHAEIDAAGNLFIRFK